MKTFLTLWIGQLVSMIGSGLTAFALGVWIFNETGEATPFAFTILFAQMPRILLAPIAGAYVDRWSRRRVMILADTGNALVTLTAVALILSGALEVWHIYAMALIGSVFSAFQGPAYTASISLLVPKKELGRANGLVQTSQALEMLLAPIIAGVLFVTVGLRGVILIDFVTYFFAIGALLIIHIPQPELSDTEQEEERSLRNDITYGWRYLRGQPGLFGLLLYFALVNFLLNFAVVLNGPLVLSFASASALGIVQTIFGIGMLAGGVAMSAWGGGQNRAATIVGAVAVSALGLTITGLRPSVLSISIGLFVLMFCVPFAAGASQAIFQSKVAPAIQGRVFAMRDAISRSTMPLAFLFAGVLADHVFEPLLREEGALAATWVGQFLGTGAGRGMGLMFVLSGLLLIVVSAVAWANPHIRLIDEELPDYTSAKLEEAALPSEETSRAFPNS